MNKTSKRAKTMIEKMGFRDKDLKTPEHDYLMMWATEKRNLADLVTTIYGIHHDKVNEFKNGLKIKELDFEKPICVFDKKCQTELKSIAGYVDCTFQVSLRTSELTKTHVIEFKSDIQSYGELIREIEYYKSFWGSAIYTILTFDDVKIPLNIFKIKGINIYQIPRPKIQNRAY